MDYQSRRVPVGLAEVGQMQAERQQQEFDEYDART